MGGGGGGGGITAGEVAYRSLTSTIQIVIR